MDYAIKCLSSLLHTSPNCLMTSYPIQFLSSLLTMLLGVFTLLLTHFQSGSHWLSIWSWVEVLLPLHTTRCHCSPCCTLHSEVSFSSVEALNTKQRDFSGSVSIAKDPTFVAACISIMYQQRADTTKYSIAVPLVRFCRARWVYYALAVSLPPSLLPSLLPLSCCVCTNITLLTGI